jgi:hypothetical protein
MLHYAAELRARVTRCGLSYDQLIVLHHGFVYDERDFWKITCPNCRGFAHPERKKQQLEVLRWICGRRDEGFPSPTRWCPLSCAMPPTLRGGSAGSPASGLNGDFGLQGERHAGAERRRVG